MSTGHHDEGEAEFERISRRMARIEISLTERILRLEAEVATLKGVKPYTAEQARDWRWEGAAQAAINKIMEK